MDNELQASPFFLARWAVFLSVLRGSRFRGASTLSHFVPKFLALVLITLAPLAFSQTNSVPAPDPHAVPVMDGGIGPCSADITVTDSLGTPVYAAKINVHIAYGFWNAHKLDLEQGTNIDGKARFVGLPDRIKRGFLFRSSAGDRAGEAFDDPASTCKAQFTITLRKKDQ